MLNTDFHMQIVAVRGIRNWLVCSVAWLVCIGQVHAQVNRGVPPISQSSNRRAIAHYSDAAAFQNNGAYGLAIEEWEKLLKEFPEDPLASKAWHYLGVCNIQLETPNYSRAVEAFGQALKDDKLEVREETLITLCWCLFNQARQKNSGTLGQQRELEQVKSKLSDFMRSYSDGAYVDQALFYLGEVEYALGNRKQAIARYNQLVESAALAKSTLRPDALHALGIALEEDQQSAKAKRVFQQFIQEQPSHRLFAEVRLRLADNLLREGQVEEAEKIFLDVSAQPDNALTDYALLRLGFVQNQRGNLTAAQKTYLDLMKRFPDSKHATTAALAVGQNLFQEGNYDEAVEQLRPVIAKQDEQAAEAAHWLATALLRQQKPNDAIKLLQDVLTWAKDSSSADSLKMDYADALYLNPEQLEKSQSLYQEIAEKSSDPDLSSRATYNVAFAALQLARPADAQKWAEIFLKKYPENPLRNDVAYVAAEALLQQGEHDAAAKAFQKLLAVDRKNVAASIWVVRQAMALYLAGKYESTLQVLADGEATFNEDRVRAEALYLRGASHLYLDRLTDAVRELSLSYQTDNEWGSSDEVLMLLAEAQQRNKDLDGARKTLNRLLENHPNSRLKSQAEYKLGQLSAALEDFDGAIERYSAILRDANGRPYHQYASYGIAWCEMQRENYERALPRLREVLRSSTEDAVSADARLAEGVCLRKLGKLDDARSSLEDYVARETGPTLANGLYELGLCLTQQGEYVAASKVLQRVVNEFPQHTSMDKILYELAWNYQEQSDVTEASKYFERLAKQFPQSELAAESIYMVAQQKYATEDFTGAVPLYVQVIETHPTQELLEKAHYKLGWSFYQLGKYDESASQFSKQLSSNPTGPLAIDAQFMQAECMFKQRLYASALDRYRLVRNSLETLPPSQLNEIAEQVQALIYLHGGQCLREQENWEECAKWLEVVLKKYPESSYLPTAIYELAFCRQNQGQLTDALRLYADVAEKYRTEVAARARFMMGEVYFSQRDFAKAIPEFQRVMYGFGGERATEDIRNWQAKSAFEAARCSEVLIEGLNGPSRAKVVETAVDFYEFIVKKHASHELASQAQARLGELQKLR
ncbi:MAG: tetratricopeptide repeat protein [Planctomycetales bacterium]|nr:tetratricopeptide repeat protein [Planctomycetales bacterium]